MNRVLYLVALTLPLMAGQCMTTVGTDLSKLKEGADMGCRIALDVHLDFVPDDVLKACGVYEAITNGKPSRK